MTLPGSNESWGSNCEAALYTRIPKPSLCVAMRRFFRRQITYFVWGFAAALLVIIAIDVGFGRLVNYAAIAAAAGVVVSAIIFMLDRRFPDDTPTAEDREGH